MKADLPPVSTNRLRRAPSLARLCREITALRADLMHARSHLPRPGYHLDLDAAEAERTVQFLRRLPARVLEVQRLIARHREATQRTDFDDILIALGVLREEPDQMFTIGGRYWQEALLLPAELQAAAVVEGDHTFEQPC